MLKFWGDVRRKLLDRSGVSLIEVLIGMVLVATIALTIAIAIVTANRQLKHNQGTSGRDTVMAYVRTAASLDSTLFDSVGRPAGTSGGATPANAAMLANLGNRRLCFCLFGAAATAFCGGAGPTCPVGAGAAPGAWVDLQLGNASIDSSNLAIAAPPNNLRQRITENWSNWAASGTVADVDFNGLYSTNGTRCVADTGQTATQIPFKCPFFARTQFRVSNCTVGWTRTPSLPNAQCQYVEIQYEITWNQNANQNQALGPVIFRPETGNFGGTIMHDLAATVGTTIPSPSPPPPPTSPSPPPPPTSPSPPPPPPPPTSPSPPPPPPTSPSPPPPPPPPPSSVLPPADCCIDVCLIGSGLNCPTGTGLLTAPNCTIGCYNGVGGCPACP